MSQQLIEALQQKAAATPRIDVWASARRRVRTDLFAKESLVFRQKEQNRYQSAPSAEALSKSPPFAQLNQILNKRATPLSALITTDNPFLHPGYYLSLTPPGRELMEWLTYESTNTIIKFITSVHNDSPSIANQDILIQKDPILAWINLREAIIERLNLKQSFAGLFQKQERIITRLGAIWDCCQNSDYKPYELPKFNEMLQKHTKQIFVTSPAQKLHTGYMAEAFFKYEILLSFCASTREKTGAGELLEKKNPMLKLSRLIITKGIKRHP